jgi:hypothetical protein
MAAAGVETARTDFFWAQAQPAPGEPPSFAYTDRVVARAVRRHILLLPVIIAAPRWARRYPASFWSPPAHPGDYVAYLRALVLRYGPRGSFWRERPDLPRSPIRQWEIWNEPHLTQYWDAPSGKAGAWPRGYVSLLKASALGIRSADRGAKVVLAGLTNDSWNQLRQLYRLGARRYFDVAAYQTFTPTPRLHLAGLRRFRQTMRRYGDARKPAWVTEMSWPASRGRTKAEPNLAVLGTTDRGMSDRLRKAYALLVSVRRNPRYRVGRVYWHTWASPYRPGAERVFAFAGLKSYDGVRFEPRPALAAYRASARRFEGCVKTTRGRCR